MWQMVCEVCGWTSGERDTKDEAKVMGIFHEQDTPGHTVALAETAAATNQDASQRVV